MKSKSRIQKELAIINRELHKPLPIGNHARFLEARAILEWVLSDGRNDMTPVTLINNLNLAEELGRDAAKKMGWDR